MVLDGADVKGRFTMLYAIPFPDISPEIFRITLGEFSFALRWYALAYVVGFLAGWRVILSAVRRPDLWPGNIAPMTPPQVEMLVTAVVIGTIVGGRMGYVLFYLPGGYLSDPLAILRIWEGGMSFHGGLIGVTVTSYIFSRREQVATLQMADVMAMAAGIGILCGRLANFINAELWGRATDLPWGVIFPGLAAQDCLGPVGLVEGANGWLCARHPSQLYEALLEGLLITAILLWLAWRRGWLKRPGALTGLFLLLYSMARFAVEFVRQPDAQFVSIDNPTGFAVAFSPELGLTMGQVLCLPMVAVGLWLILRAKSGLNA